MTATIERPPQVPEAAPARPAPQPAPARPSDIPWPAPETQEQPVTITSTVAGIFGAFGLIATLLLGLLLGGRLNLPGRSGGAAGSSAANGSATLDVSASEFKFAPGDLKIDSAGKLTVNLTNTGAVEHDFSIDGVQGHAYAKAGGNGTFTFTLPKVGTYTFFCSIPGHKEAGMKGTLTVGAASAAPAAAQTAAQPAAQPVVQLKPAVAGAQPLPLPEVPAPITRTTPASLKFEIETKEVTAQMADGVTYTFWTFGGTVPGPMLRVRQGDDVEIVLKNNPLSSVTHSIDLHAVTGPGGGAKVTQVPPGETGSFKFKALAPGVYVYHCATPMVAHHIANGMYGLIVVEPEGGLPAVDHEYYVMQGDFYLSGARGQSGQHDFNMDKMLDERPDYVLFNGSVGALTGKGALQAKVGDTVRIFFGDGGPNITSSFHVIGEIFDKVHPEGSSEALSNVQTTHVPTGGATMVEFKVEVPGDYTLVDHSLGRLEKGAAGILHVDGPEQPDIFQSILNPAAGTPAAAAAH